MRTHPLSDLSLGTSKEALIKVSNLRLAIIVVTLSHVIAFWRSLDSIKLGRTHSAKMRLFTANSPTSPTTMTTTSIIARAQHIG
jgi:hypothetical protein